MFDRSLDVLHRSGEYFADLLYHAHRREAVMMRAFRQHTGAQDAGSAEQGDSAARRSGLTARVRFAFVSGGVRPLRSATAEAAGTAVSRPDATTGAGSAALLEWLRGLTAHEPAGYIADPDRSADLGRQRQHLVMRRPSARHGGFAETGRAA